MSIDHSIGYLICTVARKIHQQLTEKFKNYEITPEQWVILKKIVENKAISQQELSVRVDKDPNNVKALVDKLETKALVRRMVNPNDKRAFALCLTEKGRNLIAELTPLDERMIVDLGYGLSDAEIGELRRLLSKIQANIANPDLPTNHS